MAAGLDWTCARTTIAQQKCLRVWWKVETLLPAISFFFSSGEVIVCDFSWVINLTFFFWKHQFMTQGFCFPVRIDLTVHNCIVILFDGFFCRLKENVTSPTLPSIVWRGRGCLNTQFELRFNDSILHLTCEQGYSEGASSFVNTISYFQREGRLTSQGTNAEEPEAVTRPLPNIWLTFKWQ